jgi:hypothetical protein
MPYTEALWVLKSIAEAGALHRGQYKSIRYYRQEIIRDIGLLGYLN